MHTYSSSPYPYPLQKHPTTETPRAETPRQRPHWTETPGQRPSLDRDPHCGQRLPWKEHGTRDRDPLSEGTWDQAAGQEVTSYKDPSPMDRLTDMCKTITLPPNFVCER